MSTRLLVEVNLAAVIANLSREEGRPVSEGEVRQWLREVGFAPHGVRSRSWASSSRRK